VTYPEFTFINDSSYSWAFKTNQFQRKELWSWCV
jgi:hypothetical protein